MEINSVFVPSSFDYKINVNTIESLHYKWATCIPKFCRSKSLLAQVPGRGRTVLLLKSSHLVFCYQMRNLSITFISTTTWISQFPNLLLISPHWLLRHILYLSTSNYLCVFWGTEVKEILINLREYYSIRKHSETTIPLA